MQTLEDQLSSLPQSIKIIEKKIEQLELTKPELQKVQNKLNALDHTLAQRSYQASPEQTSNMYELQSLLNYAKGDLGTAKKFLREIILTNPDYKLVSSLAGMISEATVKEVSNKTDSNLPDEKFKGIPHYYTVSPLRLVSFSIVTFGYYLVYWSYKNWKAIEFEHKKNGKKKKVYPILSSIFFPLVSYEMFVTVRKSMKKVDKEVKVGAGAAAWAVLFLNQLALAFLPVLVMQSHMNKIKGKVWGTSKVTKNFAAGEVVFMAMFIPVTMLIVFGWISEANNPSYTMSQAQLNKQEEVDGLTREYEQCSSNLVSREKTLDLYNQFEVGVYNADLDACEKVRIKQNTAVDEYNRQYVE